MVGSGWIVDWTGCVVFSVVWEFVTVVFGTTGFGVAGIVSVVVYDFDSVSVGVCSVVVGWLVVLVCLASGLNANVTPAIRRLAVINNVILFFITTV